MERILLFLHVRRLNQNCRVFVLDSDRYFC